MQKRILARRPFPQKRALKASTVADSSVKIRPNIERKALLPLWHPDFREITPASMARLRKIFLQQQISREDLHLKAVEATVEALGRCFKAAGFIPRARVDMEMYGSLAGKTLEKLLKIYYEGDPKLDIEGLGNLKKYAEKHGLGKYLLPENSHVFTITGQEFKKSIIFIRRSN